MKYFLFLFFISMVFTVNVNAGADIVNRNCNPEMQGCMRDIARKFGNAMGPDRQAAQSRCSAEFNECRAANGGITQSSGRVAQMYHPANPDFIECRKTIPDPTSDAFRSCMLTRTGQAKRQPETTYDGGQLNEIVVTAKRPTCSKDAPRRCTTEETCAQNNGVWDGTACAAAPCPVGTTANSDDPKYCTCDNETQPYSIERGSRQQCPSFCKAEDHKVYNIVARGCLCASGYEDRMGMGRCVSTAAPQPKVAECIAELQEKVTTCNSAATKAVEKCDPNADNGGNDSLGALQNLLGGVNGYTQAKNAGTGAMDNCINAAVASSSGYYALEELRGKCDGEINTCKTSCTDATSYISANKEKVYEKCRKKAWDDHSCTINSPYRSFTEEAFNVEWDGVNKAAFERQIQDMQKNVTDNNTKCDSGTAVANRDKMSDFMNDMNTSVKSANQCQCQLGSGQDCGNQVGPAECAVNPALPGCVKATVNCLNTADTSAKCVCFRNPNSNECKNTQQANNSNKLNATDASSFAGGGSGQGSNGGSAGKTESGDTNIGNLNGLNLSDEAIAANASGTTTADGETSPFGTTGPGGNPGGSGGDISGAAGNSTVAGSDGDDSNGKKMGGLFDVAKTALGNLFKKGKDDKSSFDGVNFKGINGGSANTDSKKWRPRGMVRGLASDTEIAGKFEDIWKVMNRQYKIQDQKDSFLFGGEKN